MRNEALRRGLTRALPVPAGGDHAFGMTGIAEERRARGCAGVRTALIANGRHDLADEHPDAVAALIERYASP